MGGNRAQDPGPAAYGREALSEWAKAARYGVRAIAARRHQASDGGRPPLKERLSPWRTSKGGRVGDAADHALSKLGTGGKLASKIGLGSRLVDRLQPSNGGRGRGEAKQGQNGSQASQDVDRETPLADAPVPIVGSIDVGVPVESAYRLCQNVDEYTGFLEHVERAERVDDTHVAIAIKAHGRTRDLEMELLGERPNERIDWECADGIPHSGAISFHPLAPRLTRVELAIEPQRQALIERLTRAVGLTDRTVRDELHRFKAFAELFEEDSDEPESSKEAPEEKPIEDQDAEEVDGDEDLEPEDVVDEETDADEEGIVADMPPTAYDDDFEDEADEPRDAYDDDFEDEADEPRDAYDDEEDFDEEEEELEEELEPAGSER